MTASLPDLLEAKRSKGHASSAPGCVADESERGEGRAPLAEKEVRGKGRQPLPLKSVPRPVWDAEAVRHVIGGPVVARHRCRGRPGEVVVQHLSQRTVVG